MADYLDPVTMGDYQAAKETIARFVGELRPELAITAREMYAAILLSRLAHRDPPLLIVRADLVKDEW